MKKFILALVAVAVLGGIVFYFVKNNSGGEPEQAAQITPKYYPDLPPIPSSDRFATRDGVKYLKDELVVILKDGVVDPQTRIDEIAAETGGRVIYYNNELLTFEVHYPSISTYEQLTEKKAEVELLLDVDSANVNAILGPAGNE